MGWATGAANMTLEQKIEVGFVMLVGLSVLVILVILIFSTMLEGITQRLNELKHPPPGGRR